MRPARIFLVGYMGCGKSTLGRALAKELTMEFVDMDSRIEQACGKSVSEIFATEGEEFFRRKEREVLEQLLDLNNSIVATGGGVPVFGDNMETMCGRALVIYLKMSPEMLVKRLAHGRDKRPLIQGMDDTELLAFIEKNLAIREPFYEKAQLVIDCNGASDKYIVAHIAMYINYLEGHTKN